MNTRFQAVLVMVPVTEENKPCDSAPCPECIGTGRDMAYANRPCENCHGRGWIVPAIVAKREADRIARKMIAKGALTGLSSSRAETFEFSI